MKWDERRLIAPAVLPSLGTWAGAGGAAGSRPHVGKWLPSVRTPIRISGVGTKTPGTGWRGQRPEGRAGPWSWHTGAGA